MSIHLPNYHYLRLVKSRQGPLLTKRLKTELCSYKH